MGKGKVSEWRAIVSGGYTYLGFVGTVEALSPVIGLQEC